MKDFSAHKQTYRSAYRQTPRKAIPTTLLPQELASCLVYAQP